MRTQVTVEEIIAAMAAQLPLKGDSYAEGIQSFYPHLGERLAQPFTRLLHLELCRDYRQHLLDRSDAPDEAQKQHIAKLQEEIDALNTPGNQSSSDWRKVAADTVYLNSLNFRAELLAWAQAGTLTLADVLVCAPQCIFVLG